MKTHISTPWQWAGRLARLAKVVFQRLLLVAALGATTLPAAEAANYALSFDGVDDQVQAGTNSFPVAFNSFTVELWVNPTGFRAPTAQATNGISDINQRFAVFPDQGDSYGANHACAGLSIGTNGISVFEHAINYLPSLLVYPTNLSGWTHVALVYVNKQPRIYVNGTLAHTGLTSAMAAVHPSASLGGSIHALGYGPFQGQLDEVRIWNGPLNQFQIQEYMNRSLTGTEAGLVVYYRCDEGAGTALADSAPANPVNHGTLVNGTAWVHSSVNVPDTDRDGMPDAWETNYASCCGLNPNDASDAANDCNGNGRTNLEEFWRGFDPCDTSVPQRLNVRKVESGLITINWGDAGTLEEAFSVPGSFSDVIGATAPYTTTPSAQMKFFRLRMEAQGYSSNAVAYVNLSLQPGLNLIQNPLDATVAGGNTVSNLLAGVPDGTTVYKWTPGTGFTVNDYTSLFGWTDPQMSMTPSEGVILYLPGTSVLTPLFVGEVMQGALATPLAIGFNLVGSRVPQAGTLQTNLRYTPAERDTVYEWDPGYNTPNAFEFGTWASGEPNIAVAEVFWLLKLAAGSWDRTFSINP